MNSEMVRQGPRIRTVHFTGSRDKETCMQGHTQSSRKGHFPLGFRRGRMPPWQSGGEEERTILQSCVEWSGHGEMVLKTGDRASEVFQNFGMSSRE